MSGELILDTGGLVSLLDRRQARHGEFVDFYRGWTGPVLSTQAVLTESTHLLRRASGGVDHCLRFFLAGGATLVPSSLSSLARCRALIAEYADLPMDYADATLVALAEDVESDLVLTTDRTDFEVYRWGGSRPFRVVP